MAATKKLAKILESNKRWSQKMKDSQPRFFKTHGSSQSPSLMWIGCSDSRVPPTEICGLLPGEIFVYRNMANLVHKNDPSLLAALHYGIETLRVETLVVCGHYGCGGLLALHDKKTSAAVKKWVEQLRDLFEQPYGEEILRRMKDPSDTLCAQKAFVELSALTQTRNLLAIPVVKDAITRSRPLSVVTLIYDVETGLLKQLS